jgi:DNA-binding NtrC family response regulator
VDITANVGTILLAEDEPGLRKVVRTVLEHVGFRVLEASDGRDAERVFAEHSASIDLVLTDVNMPKMGGVELWRRLRAIRPGVKVLYMTGYPDRALLGEVKSGDAELLQKPFTIEALTSKIRNVFEQAP